MITNNSLFIEAKRLGILEDQLRAMVCAPATTKRDRRADFNCIARILRDLRLVPPHSVVVGIALGVRSDGELGLWIAIESPVKIQGDLPA